jgi:Tol biopolymer transport system component
MAELREVFEMVTRQTEPDLDSWKEQQDRQRRRGRNRRIGAFAVAAAVVVVVVLAALAVITQREGGGSAPADGPVVPSVSSPSVTSHSFIDLRTGKEIPLADTISASASSMSVSPDGTMLTYAAEIEPYVQAVFVANLDGTNVRPLRETRLSPGGAFAPRWSPDGSQIVYQAKDGDQEVGDLFLVNVATGRTTRLTDVKEISSHLWYMSPNFSPDGETILFTMPRGGSLNDQSWDLWSVSASGGEPTLVRRDGANGAFSPDGKAIAYVELRNVGHTVKFGDLWVAGADGSGARRLVEGEVDLPRWSPDGTRIAYGEGGGISIVDVGTGETTKVFDGASMPEWLDDDTLIIDPRLGDGSVEDRDP